MAKKSDLFKFIDVIDSKYAALSKKLVSSITTGISKGLKPAAAVDAAFKLHNVNAAVKDMIYTELAEVAAAGYGVKTTTKPDKIKSYFIGKTWPGDDLTLSARVNKLNLKTSITNTVKAQFNKNLNLNNLAVSIQEQGLNYGTLPNHLTELAGKAGDRDVKKFIRKSRRRVEMLSRSGAPNSMLVATYDDVINRVEKGSARQLKKAIEQAVNEKARYNAMRIARTEMAKAHGLMHDFKASLDSDVVGVKYTLSTRHKIFDICDYHTTVDAYGMGDGVYPKNRHPPYPFHPHCMCVPSEVFRTEATTGKFEPKEAEKHLKSYSKPEKKALFGVKGAEDFKRNPKGWKKDLKNYEGQAKPDFSGLKKEWF